MRTARISLVWTFIGLIILWTAYLWWWVFVDHPAQFTGLIAFGAIATVIVMWAILVIPLGLLDSMAEGLSRGVLTTKTKPASDGAFE
jgi:hypothetical protein